MRIDPTATIRWIYFSLSALMVIASAQVAFGGQPTKRVRQPKEVVEAYRVCQRFQSLMAENLDFDRAFEATFTKNTTRRREMAIAEGEFGSVDLKRVADATLIDAFKSRMQIFFFMLPLVGPANNDEEELFFPPPIKTIFERKPPQEAEQFPAYALQLKRDAADFRAHLDQLANRYAYISERIRKFKSDLSKKVEPPNHVVKPLTAYSRGRVLGPKEEYFQIGDYAVIREGREMRIIGVRFFSRLF
jgi:CRISPR/Cas system CSM-associated protein Csm2 small subunit